MHIASRPFIAHATNGYFSHGYGIKAQGIGGGNANVEQEENIVGVSYAWKL